MASILKVDELQGITAAGDITVTSEGGAATQSLQQGLAKAWVNFTTVTTTSSRDSLNVSSLTDLTTASTRVTYSSAMNNINYSATGYSNWNTLNAEGNFNASHSGRLGLVGRATTTIQHYSYATDSAQQDVQILGDLA